MKTICVIGGYPKGFSKPFHESTLSGKRLRRISEKHCINLLFFDVWKTLEEEKEGFVSNKTASYLNKKTKGLPTVALGTYVFSKIKKYISHAVYLPHPASRRKKDLKKLEHGLVLLAE